MIIASMHKIPPQWVGGKGNQYSVEKILFGYLECSIRI